MLMVPPSVRVFLATAPCDMRRSFDGLAALVQEQLGEDPFAGGLFIFRNRRGDRVKALYWDGQGYCLFYKRMERGTFVFPGPQAGKVSISAQQLAWLLEGLDWQRLPARRALKVQAAA